MNTKNTVRFCAVICSLLIGVWLFFRTLPLTSPIVAAFVISLVIEPLIRQLMKRIRLKRAFAAPVVIVIIVAIVVGLIWVTVLKLIREYNALMLKLPELLDSANTNTAMLLDRVRQISSGLPIKITIPHDVDALFEALGSLAASNAQVMAESVAKTALGMATRVPSAIIFAITLLLATFFILTEREKYNDFFVRQLPKKWLDGLAAFRGTAFSAIFGYLRAQLIIMCVLCVLLFVGLLILRVEYALVFAVVTAFLDALPVFGSSLVLLPWALWNILIGNYFTGIGLVALFLVCSGLRRFIEPKILSTSIGINALMVVASMYAGLKIFGVAGLIAGPLIYILFRTFVTGMMKGKTFKEYFLIEDEL